MRREGMNRTDKLRLYYIVAVVLLIPIGLLSRRFSWIPVETGDALWAMMVFCLLRAVFVKRDLRYVAIGALAFSFADEFAQMISCRWLVQVRSTTLGHLILGQGFAWVDLVAYTFGIVFAYILARILIECKVSSINSF